MVDECKCEKCGGRLMLWGRFTNKLHIARCAQCYAMVEYEPDTGNGVETQNDRVSRA